MSFKQNMKRYTMLFCLIPRIVFTLNFTTKKTSQYPLENHSFKYMNNNNTY